MKNPPILTFANGTIPFNLAAAASYSGASFLQCPHLYRYIKEKRQIYPISLLIFSRKNLKL